MYCAYLQITTTKPLVSQAVRTGDTRIFTYTSSENSTKGVVVKYKLTGGVTGGLADDDLSNLDLYLETRPPSYSWKEKGNHAGIHNDLQRELPDSDPPPAEPCTSSRFHGARHEKVMLYSCMEQSLSCYCTRRLVRTEM